MVDTTLSADLRGYLATPDGDGPWPGLVVLHEAFGLGAAAKYDFDVASVNYGEVPREAEQVLRGVCPVVASYGKKDISLRGKAAKLEGVLTELGMPHDVKEYPGVGHSFLADYRTG